MNANIKKITSEIGSTKLVAVSKRQSISKIKRAIDLGVKIIGENRIQESIKKYDILKDIFKENNIKFHFIGHLQTNKVKKAVEMFNLIQTIDSLKLANEINKRAKEINKIQNILIQINIGKEPQKFGFYPEKTLDAIKEIKKFENININGLMCIHPYGKNPIPYFKEMKDIFDQTGLYILSMGMSSDYIEAIKQGSNMVRIGTKIFGERKY